MKVTTFASGSAAIAAASGMTREEMRERREGWLYIERLVVQLRREYAAKADGWDPQKETLDDYLRRVGDVPVENAA